MSKTREGRGRRACGKGWKLSLRRACRAMRRYKNCNNGAVACSDTWLQPITGACSNPPQRKRMQAPGIVAAGGRASQAERRWKREHCRPAILEAPEETQSEVKLLRAELQDQARLGPDSIGQEATRRGVFRWPARSTSWRLVGSLGPRHLLRVASLSRACEQVNP